MNDEFRIDNSILILYPWRGEAYVAGLSKPYHGAPYGRTLTVENEIQHRRIGDKILLAWLKTFDLKKLGKRNETNLETKI